VNSLISNFRLSYATQNVFIWKPRELICMSETLDCISWLDLHVSFASIVNRLFFIYFYLLVCLYFVINVRLIKGIQK